MTEKWKYLATKTGPKVKIDLQDYKRAIKHSWRVIQSGQSEKFSVVTSIRTGAKVRTMTLGQFIFNPKDGLIVHPRRWQNGLDYRRSNLIVCTMKQRQRMLPKKNSPRNTSQFKGVSYVKKTDSWRARIEVDNTQYYIGDFPNEEQAARAYNKEAKLRFGDFAYQNQIRKRSNRRD